MTFHSFLLMAPPQGNGADQSGSMISTVVMFGAIFVIFYFMIFRPQKKRQAERENLVNSAEKGDKVITASGIHGTISAVEEGTVLLQVADNVKIRVEKSAIVSLPNKKAETK